MVVAFVVVGVDCCQGPRPANPAYAPIDIMASITATEVAANARLCAPARCPAIRWRSRPLGIYSEGSENTYCESGKGTTLIPIRKNQTLASNFGGSLTGNLSFYSERGLGGQPTIRFYAPKENSRFPFPVRQEVSLESPLGI